MSKKNKFKKGLKNYRKSLREGFSEIGFENYNYDKFDTRSEVIFEPTFKVSIGAIAYKKLFSYVLASDLEVSGLGLVKPVDNGFRIYDVFVLDQMSSGGGTDLDKQAMTNLMLKVIKEKGKNVINDLRFWWHSHPHFGTFWSGTDDATSNRLANEKYLIAWVVTHNRDIRCRIELKSPFRMTLDNVPIEIEGGKHRGIVDRYRKEARGKVKGYTYPELTETDTDWDWIWDNRLQRFIYKRKERPIIERNTQLPLLPYLLGNSKKEEDNDNGKKRKLKGSTLFVNSITKQNSYNKEEVKCNGCIRDDCGNCETFKKLMRR